MSDLSQILDKSRIAALEKEKYERMWRPGFYRGNVERNVAQADFFIDQVSMKKGSSVFDIGCGAGHAARRFVERGMRVLCTDIACNTLPKANEDLPFLRCAIWELPCDIRIDYGFCNDVMEHIPPELVGTTLQMIRRSVSKEVYFEISLRADRCGALIDETLHLTVRPIEWWVAALQSHWRHVQTIAANEVQQSVDLLAIP